MKYGHFIRLCDIKLLYLLLFFFFLGGGGGGLGLLLLDLLLISSHHTFTLLSGYGVGWGCYFGILQYDCKTIC